MTLTLRIRREKVIMSTLTLFDVINNESLVHGIKKAVI
jgi:hypothetical protein